MLAPMDWTDSRASPSVWTKYPALPDVARRPGGPGRGALTTLLARPPGRGALATLLARPPGRGALAALLALLPRLA